MTLWLSEQQIPATRHGDQRKSPQAGEMRLPFTGDPRGKGESKRGHKFNAVHKRIRVDRDHRCFILSAPRQVRAFKQRRTCTPLKWSAWEPLESRGAKSTRD